MISLLAMSVAINVGVLLLLLVVACNAETSRYRRKLEASEDMPFDSDVFRAPPGYNSPQQVCSCSLSLSLTIYIDNDWIFLILVVDLGAYNPRGS